MKLHILTKFSLVNREVWLFFNEKNRKAWYHLMKRCYSLVGLFSEEQLPTIKRTVQYQRFKLHPLYTPFFECETFLLSSTSLVQLLVARQTAMI